MSTPLDTRAAELLKLLVERYIADGQPVASRTLARMPGLSWSPATIRNVMADLEDMGFVAAPHTSAGRVPTQRGYRYFVDTLLAPETLSEEQKEQIAAELAPGERSSNDLAQAASDLLSRLSQMAGVVTIPRRNLAVLQRIEFLPLSERRVLAILIVNGHEVQNRILSTERPYGADELREFARLINEHFAGMDLVAARNALARDTAETHASVHRLLRDAAGFAERVLSNEAQSDYVLSGRPNLMGFHELADVARLRELFTALDHKRDMLDLLDQCLQSDAMQIFIGGESGYRVLDECSVVTAPYYIGGQVAGVLGVIGPTRMAYGRIIPLVQETARLLTGGLKAGS